MTQLVLQVFIRWIVIYLVGIALSTFSTTEASKSIKNSSSKYYFLFLFSIVFRHLYKVDETHLHVTINDNLIWHLSSKYGCEVRVLSTNSSNMTNTTLQNWCQKKQIYKVEKEIFQESVFHRPVNLFTVNCLIIIVRL